MTSGALTVALRRTVPGVLLLAVVLSGCAPVPAAGPGLATGSGPRGGGGTGAPTGPPPWQAPSPGGDRWSPCGDGSGVTPARTPGASVDCDVLQVVPAPGSPRIDLRLIRVTADGVDPGAPPLVVLPGPEYDAATLAARLGPLSATSGHPLVVMPHRAGTRDVVRCLNSDGQRALAAVAQRDLDPVSADARGDVADATQRCLDKMEGAELRYGATGAADDLLSLRQHWGVPGLAVLTLGTGSRSALRFASDQPDAASLLVLDSPAPVTGRQENVGRAAVDGTEAALRQWAASCTRPECGPGPADQRSDRIAEAVRSAREKGAPVPAALLVDVIRAAASDLAGSSEPEASAGDRVLGEIARTGTSSSAVLRREANRLQGSASTFVATCTDLSDRVPLARVSDLTREWEGVSPAFGAVLAAETTRCASWPVHEQAALRLRPDLPVTVLTSAADPHGGAAASQIRAGELTAAGTRSVVTVTWQSPGSSILLHSSCALDALRPRLDDPGSTRPTVCPS